jgi:nitrate reductase gamma subunit
VGRGIDIGEFVKIAKPLLLITTPIGLAIGLYEGYRLAGGLVFIMAAMIGVIAVAMGSVVLTIRRERKAEERKQAERQQP